MFRRSCNEEAKSTPSRVRRSNQNFYGTPEEDVVSETQFDTLDNKKVY